MKCKESLKTFVHLIITSLLDLRKINEFDLQMEINTIFATTTTLFLSITKSYEERA